MRYFFYEEKVVMWCLFYKEKIVMQYFFYKERVVMWCLIERKLCDMDMDGGGYEAFRD